MTDIVGSTAGGGQSLVGLDRRSNRIIVNVAHSTGKVQETVHRHLKGYADVVLSTTDPAEMILEDNGDDCLSRPVMYLNGKINSLLTAEYPGHEGTVTRFQFDQPKLMGSRRFDDDSGSIDLDHERDIEDIPQVNSSAPDIVLHNHFDYQDAYLYGAKGGFVDGYNQRCIPEEFEGKIFHNVPVMFTLTVFSLNDESALSFIEIENQYGTVVTKADLGESLAEYLRIDPEMVNTPEHIPGFDDKNKQREADEMSIDQIDAAGVLLDLEDQEDAYRAQQEFEELAGENELQSMVTDEVAIDYAQPMKPEPVDFVADAQSFVADLFKDIANDVRGARDDEILPMKQQEEQIFDEEGGISDLDSDTDAARERKNQQAIMADMAMEGAATLSEALQNDTDELDDTFDDELDGFDDYI